ncbi:MAG: D-alanine--poly(phosphoribitol) ligase subunit DltA [Streptococcaceae bacterium]|jgi:D-alanine--poly(phosphoribitol) ligase subunit 1|nr:D-alanine--poly(phosphoribitol) ligase subunit DltA [Streptococcaceae bacterium]
MLLKRILESARLNLIKIAVAEKDAAYSYLDLLDAVTQFQAKIAEEATSSRPVLVFGRNDFLMLAAMLGAMLSGRAYVPVDAHTPDERLEMIVAASKPSLIFSTAELTDAQRGLFSAFTHVEMRTFEKTADFDVARVDTSNAVSADKIAYIIYTSGTTGVPKGVAVSVRNLETFSDWMISDFEQIKENQILEQPPYSFDLSIFSIYPSLLTAGTLVSLSKDETSNFKLLFERLNTTVINTWISTPSFVDIFLLDPSFTQENHPALTQFIFCGEELTHKTAEKLLAKFPSATVYNTFGPTEATGAISSVKITPEILESYGRLPIGKAKPGVSLHILDGEIIISGNSVATGYFENPEKTAAAFFMLAGMPAYHTGDAGFIDEKGQLNYQGRLDFQVKFNGYRIELQDIEAHLIALSSVNQAIVLAKENDQHKVTALIAVLVADKPSALTEREFSKMLKGELAKTLMDYMMPTKFVYRSELPLNQNGKIDRKRLEAEIL